MAKERQSSVLEAISASLLKVATALEEQGKVHQALSPYLKLIEEHGESQEAATAIEKVLAIGEALRERGQPHMAVTVLERLEAASQESGLTGPVTD